MKIELEELECQKCGCSFWITKGKSTRHDWFYCPECGNEVFKK